MRLLVALGVLVLGLMLASLLIGPGQIGLRQALQALIFGGSASSDPVQELVAVVMREIRLPRALLGAMVGAALGLSGAAMQGYLRNPLAEPGLIGISPAASLGAVIALQTGLAAAFAAALPLMALGFAGGAVALLFLLAGPRGGALGLILGGIALSALAGALMSLVLNLSPNPFAASEIVFWLMGSLADRSLLHVALAAPVMALGVLALWGTGRGLDALTLGEDAAQSLGVRIKLLRARVVLGVAALVGAATAVAGGVGFVGLVVPHLLRPLVGGRPSRLLAASALGGAAMILAADIATRLIAPERDLKLGVLTAIIGTPFFLRLIWRMREGRE